MKNTLKEIAHDINDKANNLTNKEIFEHFKNRLQHNKIKTVRSINSNDLFHIIDDSFVFQIRNNVKFCPIHEVPAKVLLNQKNIEEALIINFLENNVIFKEVNK